MQPLHMHMHGGHNEEVMRTTVEIADEHRARLVELAARRKEKGFSRIVSEAIEQYLEALDVAAAGRAADIRRDLERKGVGIGMADSLIAGIVLHVGGTLLTRNLRHFQRVEGLNLVRFE